MKQLKTRRVWGFNPVTRVVPSKKQYKSSKDKQMLKKYTNW